MPPATRVGDNCTGHGSFGPRPYSAGSPNVFTNGRAAIRMGDPLVPHGSPSPSPPHGGSAAAGSSTVFINSQPAIRIGDPITCGSGTAQGSPTVNMGG
ncbi:baseplate puncturing device [Vibrio phage vB_VcorM_GR11A]|nr:baseplate puncturing device [Vibrio phage vB_VcorM_GR11A]